MFLKSPIVIPGQPDNEHHMRQQRRRASGPPGSLSGRVDRPFRTRHGRGERLLDPVVIAAGVGGHVGLNAAGDADTGSIVRRSG